MKDTKKQREKDESDVKTKSPHSIATPSKPSTSSTPSSSSSSAPASNVLKITKKSHAIQKRTTNNKTNSVQTKLMSVKNENGTKSVIVTKVAANTAATPVAKVPAPAAVVTSKQPGARIAKIPAKTNDSKRVATQVESKKIVDTRPKATPSTGQKEKKPVIVSKTTQKSSPSPSNVNQINCKYCNLRFTTPVWLKKHIDRNHAKQALADVASKSDASVKILKYKQQLENIQQTLDRKNAKQNPKRVKVSPKKQRLREQLKQQLAAQQKLLQVQQEIFEKTSKAQQDIFNLIAKLGDDDDEEDNIIDEDSMDGDEAGISSQITIGNVKFEDKSHPSEMYIEDPNVSELIISDTPNEAYEYYPTENYGGLEEQYVADEDGNITVMNADGTILGGDGDVDMPHQQQSLTVLVRSDEGVEEFELVELDDQMCDDAGIGGGAGIDFEVIGQDTNSMHCRIVSNENANVEEIEYVEVQTEHDEQHQQHAMDDDVLRKQPIKLEMDKLQQIAQKRFKWQQQSINTISKNIKSDTTVEEVIAAEAAAADEANGSDTKVLNTTIHKSEKQTNEYIAKVVQNAVPTDDNKFECPICMELVSNRYSLGPHILRLHSKQKSKICQYCDRSFTCTGDLTRHIRIHTGEKPFKCTYPNCQYAFRASGDLHKHMRRHNSTTVNIRQHVCSQCERAFERGYDLKRHELTHKKNEEGIGYTCEFCSKRFVRKDQHKAHVYRHLGIKQYKCPDCNRHFSDFSNCSKHIRQCQAGDVQPFGTEDEDVPQYVCDICNKRFKSKMGMKQHIVKCTQITEMQRKLQESFKEMDDEEN